MKQPKCEGFKFNWNSSTIQKTVNNDIHAFIKYEATCIPISSVMCLRMVFLGWCTTTVKAAHKTVPALSWNKAGYKCTQLFHINKLILHEHTSYAGMLAIRFHVYNEVVQRHSRYTNITLFKIITPCVLLSN